MHGFKEVVFVFLRGKGGGGGGEGGRSETIQGAWGACSTEIRTSEIAKCVLANYYGTQHSCLESLINSAHHNTRKMVPIKKRASSFPITVCHPA